MKSVEKTCKNCNKSFFADIREVKRNNGKFCSLSCAAIYNNNKRGQNMTIINICKQCSREFSSSRKAKYCSNICKQKNYRLKSKSNNKLDRFLFNALKKYPCEICDWNLAPRDIHHILPVSEGGKNTIDNLICLCPNHHRMIHANLFSQDYLLEIVKSRTISSSLQLVLDKILKYKEQDANLVIKGA